MQIYRPRLTHLNEKEVLRYAGQRDHQKMILVFIDLFLSFYFFLEKIQGFEKGLFLQSVEMVES